VSSELDAHSKWGAPDEIPFVILGTDKGSAARSRHDVSHELGHLVIHRNVPMALFNRKSTHAILERQAHQFASCFLMPEQTFSEDFYAPTLDAFRAMKPKWKVSIASMLHRSIQLKLISVDNGTRLWINLGRRKWKTHEPLDDTLEPEQPKLLERSLKLLSDNQILSLQDIAHVFGFSDSDVESLVGLPPGSLDRGDRRIELITLPQEKAPLMPDHDEDATDGARTIRFPASRRTSGDR
jgi:Zn-dependent peptidase ImmA (M78 family)